MSEDTVITLFPMPHDSQPNAPLPEFYRFTEFVFPLVEVSSDNGESRITRFLGTGFFIGGSGYFLTANHVLAEARALEFAREGKTVVLLTPTLRNEQRQWQVTPITVIEDGPIGMDLTIGRAQFSPPRFFSMNGKVEVYGWDDVHSYGFPDTNTRTRDGGFRFNGQFVKGYVQRRVQGEAVGPLQDAAGYLVSYPIVNGMSGSPVFRTGPEHTLVGIGIGSHESWTVIWEKTECDGTTERTVRAAETGIVLSVAALKDWRPHIAEGKVLPELF